MDKHLTADAILAQVKTVQTRSSAFKRKSETAIVFIATAVSLVSGLAGFINAFQNPDKQNFIVGLVMCAGLLLVIRGIRSHRRSAAHVPYIPAHQSVILGEEFGARLAPRIHVSPLGHFVARVVRACDNVAWILLVGALTVSASAIFVLSAFGLYRAAQGEIQILDLVMLIGLVRPIRSAVSGISKMRSAKSGERQRIQTFSKSFHYAVQSMHTYIDKLSQSGVGVLHASTAAINKASVGMATTASTVAVSVAVSGMGLASAHVAPQAVIATGEVIPLPPVVVEFTGPEGREAVIRGAVFYGCVGTLLDNGQATEQQCHAVVQQADEKCANWQGGALPPECANALSGVLPQVVDSMQSNRPAENVDGSRGIEGESRNPTDPNIPPGDPQQQNQADSGGPGSKSGPCVAAPGGRPCPSENPAGQSGGKPGQQPLPSQGGSDGALPSEGRTPGSPPGGSDGAPPSEGGRPGSPPGGSDGAPPSEGGRPGSPPGGSDGAPPSEGGRPGSPTGGSGGAPPSEGGTPGSPPGGSAGAPPSEGGTPGSPPGGSAGAPPSEGGTPGSPPGESAGALPSEGGTPGSPPGGSAGAPPSEGGTPGSPPGGSAGAPPSEGGTPGSPPGRSDVAPSARPTDVPKPTR